MVNTTVRLISPREKNAIPIAQTVGGPQGQSELSEKISPLPGFDIPIIQPVASKYRDYTTPAIDNIHLEPETL